MELLSVLFPNPNNMNIKELKQIIADLPDHMEVLEGPHEDLSVSGPCWARVTAIENETPFLWIQH